MSTIDVKNRRLATMHRIPLQDGGPKTASNINHREFQLICINAAGEE
jgi:hypothetical protein